MKNTNLYILSKKIAKRILPQQILNTIKKNHYLKVLKEFDINDEIDLKVVRLLVKKNDNVLDIGANIGIYSKFLSEFVGASGKVFAFEPIRVTYGFLKRNVKKLNLNVDCFNLALSSSNGEVVMEIPSVTAGENYFRARIIGDDNSKFNFRTYKIKTRILDEMKEIDLNKISFIKCDVEGHELAVLKGCIKTIESTKCSLLVEINDNPKTDPDAMAVFDLLNNLGYSAFWFDGKVLKKYYDGDKSINYFFLLENHLDQIRNSGLLIKT